MYGTPVLGANIGGIPELILVGKTGELFESGNGYRDASELKDAKITTVQIKELVNMGIIERVSHGHYWLVDEENGKPENYKMIEACRVNSRAVICADSACYYHA